MRLFLLFFVALLGSFPAAAGTVPSAMETVGPAPFVDLLHARHDGDFYDRQAREWKALATGDCATGQAWFHYYKTAHYSNRFGGGEHDLEAIVAAAEKVCDPEGFDLNYIKFANNPDPTTNSKNLLAAYHADPDRPEAYPAMATYYEVNGFTAERNDILNRMHQSNPIPAGVIEYNYNQLMSVAPNGILVTHGDTDTYPSWLLQTAYGIRPDVRIFCLPLVLGFDAYRAQTLGGDFSANSVEDLRQKVFNLLLESPEPLHLAATASYLDGINEQHLYLTGLAFRYSRTPVDNIGLLAQSYRTNWRLDHLRQPLADGPVQAVADQLNQNYLPALLELYELQQKQPGNQFQELMPLLQSLAKRAGRSRELVTYLRGGNPPQLASNDPGLRAKDIYKGTVFIPEGTLLTGASNGKEKVKIEELWVQATEVSNADYQLFLEDLLRQRKFGMLDSTAVAPLNLEDIRPFFPEGFDLTNFDIHLAGSHPAFEEYPVLNVSRRAVELYAIWLAQVYNQDPKRIDGKNVRFRLPTAAEFEFAAKGGKKYAPYPWGGPYTRNSKGCYLANFNVLLPQEKVGNAYVGIDGQLVESTESSEARKARLDALAKEEACGNGTEDGGILTVPVDAYFPNDYGLYNMGGNAGEMIAEEGKTMGGSWLHEDFYMQVSTIREQPVPHPSTGFRLVMEYID